MSDFKRLLLQRLSLLAVLLPVFLLGYFLRREPKADSASESSKAAILPEYVWIPDDSATITVECVIPKTAPVGEWVTLDAMRKTEPWKRVARSAVPHGRFWQPRQPVAIERQIAAGLQWQVEPKTAVFDVATSLENVDLHTKYRQVKFLEPGTYRIRGINAVPMYGESPWYTVDVK